MIARRVNTRKPRAVVSVLGGAREVQRNSDGSRRLSQMSPVVKGAVATTTPDEYKIVVVGVRNDDLHHTQTVFRRCNVAPATARNGETAEIYGSVFMDRSKARHTARMIAALLRQTVRLVRGGREELVTGSDKKTAGDGSWRSGDKVQLTQDWTGDDISGALVTIPAGTIGSYAAVGEFNFTIPGGDNIRVKSRDINWSIVELYEQSSQAFARESTRKSTRKGLVTGSDKEKDIFSEVPSTYYQTTDWSMFEDEWDALDRQLELDGIDFDPETTEAEKNDARSKIKIISIGSRSPQERRANPNPRKRAMATLEIGDSVILSEDTMIRSEDVVDPDNPEVDINDLTPLLDVQSQGAEGVIIESNPMANLYLVDFGGFGQYWLSGSVLTSVVDPIMHEQDDYDDDMLPDGYSFARKRHAKKVRADLWGTGTREVDGELVHDGSIATYTTLGGAEMWIHPADGQSAQDILGQLSLPAGATSDIQYDSEYPDYKFVGIFLNNPDEPNEALRELNALAEDVAGQFGWSRTARKQSAAGPKTIAIQMLEFADELGDSDAFWDKMGYMLNAPGTDSVTMGINELNDLYSILYQANLSRDFEKAVFVWEQYRDAAPEGTFEQLQKQLLDKYDAEDPNWRDKYTRNHAKKKASLRYGPEESAVDDDAVYHIRLEGGYLPNGQPPTDLNTVMSPEFLSKILETDLRVEEYEVWQDTYNLSDWWQKTSPAGRANTIRQLDGSPLDILAKGADQFSQLENWDDLRNLIVSSIRSRTQMKQYIETFLVPLVFDVDGAPVAQSSVVYMYIRLTGSIAMAALMDVLDDTAGWSYANVEDMVGYVTSWWSYGDDYYPYPTDVLSPVYGRRGTAHKSNVSQRAQNLLVSAVLKLAPPRRALWLNYIVMGEHTAGEYIPFTGTDDEKQSLIREIDSILRDTIGKESGTVYEHGDALVFWVPIWSPNPEGIDYDEEDRVRQKVMDVVESAGYAAEWGKTTYGATELYVAPHGKSLTVPARKQATQATTVMNLSSDEEATFSLPPDEAVVAAFEQFERKNFNTWDYPKPQDHPNFVEGDKSVACGDWAALKVGRVARKAQVIPEGDVESGKRSARRRAMRRVAVSDEIFMDIEQVLDGAGVTGRVTSNYTDVVTVALPTDQLSTATDALTSAGYVVTPSVSSTGYPDYAGIAVSKSASSVTGRKRPARVQAHKRTATVVQDKIRILQDTVDDGPAENYPNPVSIPKGTVLDIIGEPLGNNVNVRLPDGSVGAFFEDDMGTIWEFAPGQYDIITGRTKGAPNSWVADEDIWDKAKEAVGSDDGSYDDYWAVVTTVYKNMGGKVKNEGRKHSRTSTVDEVRAGGRLATDERTTLATDVLSALQLMAETADDPDIYKHLAEDIQDVLDGGADEDPKIFAHALEGCLDQFEADGSNPSLVVRLRKVLGGEDDEQVIRGRQCMAYADPEEIWNFDGVVDIIESDDGTIDVYADDRSDSVEQRLSESGFEIIEQFTDGNDTVLRVKIVAKKYAGVHHDHKVGEQLPVQSGRNSKQLNKRCAMVGVGDRVMLNDSPSDWAFNESGEMQGDSLVGASGEVIDFDDGNNNKIPAELSDYAYESMEYALVMFDTGETWWVGEQYLSNEQETMDSPEYQTAQGPQEGDIVFEYNDRSAWQDGKEVITMVGDEYVVQATGEYYPTEEEALQAHMNAIGYHCNVWHDTGGGNYVMSRWQAGYELKASQRKRISGIHHDHKVGEQLPVQSGIVVVVEPDHFAAVAENNSSCTITGIGQSTYNNYTCSLDESLAVSRDGQIYDLDPGEMIVLSEVDLEKADAAFARKTRSRVTEASATDFNWYGIEAHYNSGFYQDVFFMVLADDESNAKYQLEKTWNADMRLSDEKVNKEMNALSTVYGPFETREDASDYGKSLGLQPIIQLGN